MTIEYKSYEEAIKIMEEERKETGDIGIFADSGWGDDPEMPTYYTIIKNGNGQEPIAHISKETFKLLMEKGLLGPNRLQTYKARKFHCYKEV